MSDDFITPIDDIGCPACGEENMVVFNGKLQCAAAPCPGPYAAANLLTKPQRHHVVEVTETGWTLQHPLIERLDGGLFHCRLNKVIVTVFDRVHFAPGYYQATLDPEGEKVHFAPVHS